MAWCFKCGISGDKKILYEAISREGIVKICMDCSYKEDIPVINKKEEEIKPRLLAREPTLQKRSTVYERLSRMSGYQAPVPEKEPELKKQETSLKKMVEKNYEDKIQQAKPREDLIDNFHWIIMRTRRRKKVTQEQMAREIAEPESAVKMAEQGVITDDRLIRKIESYLGIKIRKEQFIEESSMTQFEYDKQMIIERVKSPEEIKFDQETSKTLTISDLQRLKMEKEGDIFIPKRPREEIKEKEEDILKKKEDELEFTEMPEGELSDDEIDDIIFGRK
ncbi:MAG: hypothetical protein ABIB79_02350 [archaeon]